MRAPALGLFGGQEVRLEQEPTLSVDRLSEEPGFHQPCHQAPMPHVAEVLCEHVLESRCSDGLEEPCRVVQVRHCWDLRKHVFPGIQGLQRMGQVIGRRG